MQEIYFKKLNLDVNEKKHSFFSLNEEYLVVVLQSEIDTNEYVNNLYIYHIKEERMHCEYSVTTAEQITSVLKCKDAYLLIFDKEYEDGVIDETPNAYFWDPVKGFYKSFYAGRYINSIKIDNDQNIWIGYDEMGIFSMIDGELSEKGFNRFDSTCRIKPVLDKENPHTIDHYYDSFVTGSYVYLFYNVVGEKILKKIDLELDKVVETRKINLDLGAICEHKSSLYLFVWDSLNYEISKALKTNDFVNYLELRLLDLQTNEKIVFTDITSHNNIIAGLDDYNNIYIGKITED